MRIMELENILESTLSKYIDSVTKTGTLSPDDVKVLKDTFKLKKLMRECEEMDGEDGYSTRRGRSRTTGRYVSRGRSYESPSYGSNDMASRGSYRGYSGHGIMEHLEMMYDEAGDEQERRMIEEWMRKAEQK